MKRTIETGIGVNVVYLNPGVEYDALEALLDFIERHLRDAGVSIEFTNVEPYRFNGNGSVIGIRFDIEKDGRAI